jgi:hypothetical protein
VSALYQQLEVSAVVSELARSIVRYAPGGANELTMSVDGQARIGIRATDSGSGITNLDEVLSGKYSGVKDVLEKLDSRLQGTRGATAMVCFFDGQLLTGCSVGNVELRARGTRVSVAITPGILGSRVQHYRAFQTRVSPFSCRVGPRIHRDSPLDSGVLDSDRSRFRSSFRHLTLPSPPSPSRLSIDLIALCGAMYVHEFMSVCAVACTCDGTTRNSGRRQHLAARSSAIGGGSTG